MAIFLPQFIEDMQAEDGQEGEGGEDDGGTCDLCDDGSYVDAATLPFSEHPAGTQQCNACGYTP
jgi:hypothetical protein